MKNFPEHAKQPHMKLEAEIVSRVIGMALKMDMAVSVFDGEEYAVSRSRDRKKIEEECFATDETTFRLFDSNNVYAGFVQFIHGNSGHVISDYSAKPLIEQLVAPAVAYSESKGW